MKRPEGRKSAAGLLMEWDPPKTREEWDQLYAEYSELAAEDLERIFGRLFGRLEALNNFENYNMLRNLLDQYKQEHAAEIPAEDNL